MSKIAIFHAIAVSYVSRKILLLLLGFTMNFYVFV